MPPTLAERQRSAQNKRNAIMFKREQARKAAEKRIAANKAQRTLEVGNRQKYKGDVLDDRLSKDEQHVILNVNGRREYSNYAGPYTKVEERVALGRKPKTWVDHMSIVHDLERVLARNQADVKKADDDFIKRLPKAYIRDKPIN